MTVRNRHTEALSRDSRRRSLNDLISIDSSPYLQRLLLGLLLFSADIGDEVVDHLRPRLEILACSGNSLIRAGKNLCKTELSQRMERRNVALDRAVGLDCDKASPGAETFSLCLDYLNVVGIDLRHDHRNIGSKSVGRVIGNDGALSLCIGFLESLYLIFLHIDRTETEINH